MLHSRVDSWPYPQIFDQAGTACQGQTLKLVVTGAVKSLMTLAQVDPVAGGKVPESYKFRQKLNEASI